MKLYKFFFILIIFSSCRSKIESKPIEYSNTKELTESRTDVISFRKQRNNDIVGHLYEQALEHDQGLNRLEQKISSINKMQTDSLEKITEFQDYNALYYQSAKEYAFRIMDTVKRKEVFKMLKDSNEELRKKINQHNSEVKLTSELMNILIDEHNSMKIIVSESLMRAYQKEIPNIEQIKHLNQNINELIEQSKEFTKIEE